MTTDLSSLVQQYNDTMENLLRQTNKLLVQYQNSLFREEADANRLVLLEEIGQPVANSFITLTNKIAQPFEINGILISIDANKPVNLTIDRYTQVVQNAQTTQNLLAPVQYFAGPGTKLQIAWSTAPTNTPYFCVWGKLIGSHFG